MSDTAQSLPAGLIQGVSDAPSAVGAPPTLSTSPNSSMSPSPSVSPTPGMSPTPSVPPTTKYTSIVDVLVEAGQLTPDQISEIQVEHMSTGTSLEEIIKTKSYISEEALTRAKATFNDIPFVKISESGSDPQALSRIPESVARNYEILPISFNKQDGTLVVAMKDPLDLAAIHFAEQKSGLRLVTRYAMPSELERYISEHYTQSLSSEVTEALEQTSQVADIQLQKQDLASLSNETIRQAPITKIVQTIVSFAIKARASDVHIEPQISRTRVRYRIDGILTEKLILPSTVHEAVVSRIKILSGLKIDEKRLPQDGRFTFNTSEEEVDLRISTLPTIHGEKIVMRLLKKDTKVPDLPELGITGLALRNIRESIKVPHGIILVTGPTGSGKTTTLYSILHAINTPKVNIVTLEDPVEYQMPGINQVQTNPQAGLSFASGLRSFLRQDPNVIMVGEIRDSETADLAIQASLTGHLVFSTLHTSSSAGAIPRLMDMGAEPFLLASSMTLVMAQRVVRIINPDFKEEYKPEPEIIEDFKKVLGPHFDNWCKQHNKTPETITLCRVKKDATQTDNEYKGRIGIFEVMKISEEIAKLILERKPAQELEDAAFRQGMLLMKQDGYLKVLDGITTLEEVLRVAEI
jgi:type IV pilus assembly protein PilB